MVYIRENFLRLVLVSLLAVFAAGCYKDLGNYDYKAINSIELGKMPDTLRVFQYDTLKVKLPVSALLDSSILNEPGRFTYQWIASTGNADYVLDSSRELKAYVVIPPGKYTLIFRMRDTKTNNLYSKKSNANALSVVTGTYEGWLVFSEVQGRAQLDMVNFVNGQAPTIARDILRNSPVIPRQLTGARDVCYTYSTPTSNQVPGPGHDSTKVTAADAEWIYICTDQGAWKLRNDVLTTRWQWTIAREFILQDSASFRPGFCGNGRGIGVNGAYLYVYDNKGNFFERAPSAYYEASRPINNVSTEGKTFKAAPFFCRYQNTGRTFDAVLFDTEKKRFLRYTQGAGTCTPVQPNAIPDPLFDFNDVKKDLVWMKTTLFNTLTYAILRGADGATWLATFNLSSGTSQDRYVRLTGTDIDKATLFTVDRNYGTLFYAVGGKVYATSKFYPDQSYLVLDKGEEKITYLDQHIFLRSTYFSTDPEHPASHVMVGSYHEGTGVGTLEGYYPADFVNAHAAFTKKSAYTGFGKIRALSYRER